MNSIGTNKEEFFINVKDFKLHVNLFGKKTNKPTVVMEAGYGDYSEVWKEIAPEIAKITQVVLYDRAGLGKSEKSSNQRTSDQMVNELKELLTNMEIDPPYILVGHSFGGVNMRLYATEYPNEVNGLVLIDSTHEDYRDRFLPTMSVEFQDAYKKQFIYEGNYDEFMFSLELVKEKRSKLDVPLVVISAGKKAHYSTHSQELWNEMQQELLSISSKGEFIIAKNSAHYIQNDEPMVVIDAIKRLLV
ncbi:alpha/beta hydrolase [Pullulanibacillus sp. KACC 23026]|uniref:alpha/beta fold hydrolase n=1 Tax=Pullulanibacillus sp. KACC 23026 TaxID=3028315 RepID=UPI0023AE805B|nr:alpha/beta hydrolase [Pullulanibacillus sp. KACC 23026]WEG14486.1 alpha/beta hydrolase [Pullulanibacillus sp. KACC 23026]